MKCICLTAALAVAIVMAAAGPVSATSVRVEPVLLELNAPTAAGTLTLRNDEDVDVAVQTRVFRWSQVDGKDSLEPATDVAASPPIVTLAPGADYTIRVVRTSRSPVLGEEDYRVLVDQLPNSRRQNQAGVNILVRQSIPVFFRARQLSRANVSWSLRLEGSRLLIIGTNSGDERMRIASLHLRDAAGRTALFGNGLVGYVLGGSSMTFTFLNPPHGFGSGGPVSITAESNAGTVHAMASLQIQP